MTCSWASRLISLVVNDSDDKTTTFTLLLFNFYLFPQAFLSITDSSLPLSVFLSVHLSSHPSSLLFSLGAFCLFTLPCHELTTFFLSNCVFFIRLSIFLPYLFPLGSLVACCRSLRPVKPILPFIFVLFYPAAFSVCLFITPLFCIFHPHFPSFGILHALLLILTSPLRLFYLSSSSGWEGALAFDVAIFFPPWALRLSCRVMFPSSAFQVFEFFSLCPLRRDVIEHWGKLDRESEQTCSTAEREISQISLQQWAMVITVDKNQGIKLLPYGFPMYILRVNSFHLSVSLSTSFSLSVLFFSHCLSSSLILSKKLNSETDQIQLQSHQQLSLSSLLQCIRSPPHFLLCIF